MMKAIRKNVNSGYYGPDCEDILKYITSEHEKNIEAKIKIAVNDTDKSVLQNRLERIKKQRDKEELDNNQNILDEYHFLKEIFGSAYSSLYIDTSNPSNNENYVNIKTISFRKKNIKCEKKLIYNVKKKYYEKVVEEASEFNENKQYKESVPLYYLETGLFIGYISFKYKKHEYRIELESGYKRHFLTRMLDVANNIYFDTSNNEHVKANKADETDLISLILEHIFLTNFRRAYSMGMPLQYINIKESGFNVKGRIDIKKYISHDMIYGQKLSYSYNRLSYVQDIIDVLYYALKTIKDNHPLPGDIAKYYSELKQLYSGNRPTMQTIKKISNHKSLNNPIYSTYKQAIKYARYIIEHKNLLHDENENSEGVSGFLIDISELWEVYLAHLLEKGEIIDSDSNEIYSVDSQSELTFYKDTFFARPNYPDIVMETKKSIVILDAKFKKMRFINSDVDRYDLFQINAYAGYYRAIQEFKKFADKQTVKLCSLVYPHASEDEDYQIGENENIKDEIEIAKVNKGERSNTICGLYGLEYGTNPFQVSTNFSIEYIEVGNNMNELIVNERQFLERMKEHIDGEISKR